MDKVIKVQGLWKSFGTFKALKGVDLNVKAGDKIVICGPSGSGKSTLIRCLNGLEIPDEGLVEVIGHSIGDDLKQIKAVRRRVGMVFQQFNLFSHLTVLDNLMLAPLKVLGRSRDDVKKQAMELLEKVKISEQAHKFPAQLSGGQQQRVAIARALCMEPEVLLFDEPTSALDPEMIKEVLDVMIDLAQSGVTMICVTHEMGFARKVADRVVFMEEGAVVEEASAVEFFDAPKHARTKMFLSQILQH